MLSKEDFASVSFFKLEVPLMLSGHAAEIVKKLVHLLYLVLDLTKLVVKNSCSLTSLACSRKFRS
jgi:hypothetical protein